MNLSGSRVIRHSLPRRILHNHSGVVSIALFFIFCCVVFSLITNNFLSSTNWLNIVRQSAPLLIV
ncbi:MAG: ABC transporter permease, partial [Serratia sp.]|nr:ABC transporter permease [Serratia sp. (in: enterobacteria)]